MQVGKMRVAQMETGIEAEMYRLRGQEDIMEMNHKQISHIETECKRKLIQVNGPNKEMNCRDRFRA